MKAIASPIEEQLKCSVSISSLAKSRYMEAAEQRVLPDSGGNDFIPGHKLIEQCANSWFNPLLRVVYCLELTSYLLLDIIDIQ